MKETFSKKHDKIISELEAILKHSQVDDKVVKTIASWGRTQDSNEVLNALQMYRERVIDGYKGMDISSATTKENKNYMGYDEGHDGRFNDFYRCPDHKCETFYITTKHKKCYNCGLKLWWDNNL